MQTAKRQEPEMDGIGALTAEEFRARFRIGASKFYDLVKAGQLRVVKNGAKNLILFEDAQAWARSLPEARQFGSRRPRQVA